MIGVRRRAYIRVYGRQMAFDTDVYHLGLAIFFSSVYPFPLSPTRRGPPPHPTPPLSSRARSKRAIRILTCRIGRERAPICAVGRSGIFDIFRARAADKRFTDDTLLRLLQFSGFYCDDLSRSPFLSLRDSVTGRSFPLLFRYVDAAR